MTETHSYIAYPVTDEFELYNVVSDPYQLDNVFTSTPQAVLDRYATRLKRMLRCAGVTCRSEDRWNVP